MKNSIYSNTLLVLSSILIVFAPLIRSGKDPASLLIMELLGVCILFVIFWSEQQRGKIPKKIWGMLSLIIIIPLFYLIPLPENILGNLSGRELYNEVTQWAADNSPPTTMNTTVSLIPEKTLNSFLSLIPAIAVFIAIMSMTINKVRMTCYVFLAIAALEALLGIAQFSTGNEFLYFGVHNSHYGFSLGTYLNRDHFVALIEMALPVTVALLIASYLQKNAVSRHWGTVFYFILIIIFLIAAIFSHSRSGIFLSFLGILLAIISFSTRIGKKKSLGIITISTALGISIASTIGIIPIINRFIAHNPMEDGRALIFKHSIEGINNFFPIGSGPGTFPYVYRAFQPIEQRGFINHAHNDYLEILFEMGIIGAVAVCFFFVIYLSNWKSLFKSQWLPFRYMQTASGISIFLILLHSLTDFNLHTPANLVFFALLLGIFFHQPEKKPAKNNRRYKIQPSTKSLNPNKISKDRKKSISNTPNPFSK